MSGKHLSTEVQCLPMRTSHCRKMSSSTTTDAQWPSASQRRKLVASMLLCVCRWEEGPSKARGKWRKLTHKGPVFPKPYKRLPQNVKFFYNGEAMSLSKAAEEVAGFYARLPDYSKRANFKKNFFKDWRKVRYVSGLMSCSVVIIIITNEVFSTCQLQ